MKCVGRSMGAASRHGTPRPNRIRGAGGVVPLVDAGLLFRERRDATASFKRASPRSVVEIWGAVFLGPSTGFDANGRLTPHPITAQSCWLGWLAGVGFGRGFDSI